MPVGHACEFAPWYASYPRKVAKSDAGKAYRQLTAAQRDVLTRNTPAWVVEFSRRPSDKVPYPATFLRRGMWEDPPPKPAHDFRIQTKGAKRDDHLSPQKRRAYAELGVDT